MTARKLCGALALIITITLVGMVGVGHAQSGPAQPASNAATHDRAIVSAVTTPPANVTVNAVGDLLFDLSPRRLIASKGGKAPLAHVASQLRKADLTIGNLENPLSNRGASVQGKPSNLIFEGDPRGVQSLTASGIDIVALANNHMMDHGKTALADTLKTLGKADIAHAGAGMNTKAAWQAATVVRNGARISYLSFTDIIPSGFTPSKSRPGVAVGTNMKKVTSAIRSAKKHADYVIVSFHQGIEQSYTANSQQIKDAHAAVNAGADLVLSHHPHVVQAFEFYHHRLIAYSLGNFIFPYKTTEGRKSVILSATLTPSGTATVSVTPVYLGDYGCPKPVKGSLARSILKRVKSTSGKRGTKVVISGTTARLR